MRQILVIAILTISVAALLTTSPVASAQQSPHPPQVPIPAQIYSAKKVFIANGGRDFLEKAPDRTYNDFYICMKSWGQYELVTSPVGADLVFEIRAVETDQARYLRLVILDPKTNIKLWTIAAGPIYSEGGGKNSRKDYDKAMPAVVDDVKKLIATPIAAVAPANK